MVFQQAPIPQKIHDNSGFQDHLVFLTLHHLIGDLWSVAIILSEIAALYREENTGVPASLKPLRASYAAKTYRGRITLFRAARSGSNENGAKDLTLGWGALAEGGVDVHFIQSNHVALLVKPHVEILTQELTACLE